MACDSSRSMASRDFTSTSGLRRHRAQMAGTGHPAGVHPDLVARSVAALLTSACAPYLTARSSSNSESDRVSSSVPCSLGHRLVCHQSDERREVAHDVRVSRTLAAPLDHDDAERLPRVQSFALYLVNETGEVDRLGCLALDRHTWHTGDVSDIFGSSGAVCTLAIGESVLA